MEAWLHVAGNAPNQGSYRGKEPGGRPRLAASQGMGFQPTARPLRDRAWV
jgi:hypothetical protein